ncbi:HET-domain-containing protein, partial [Byssothecium circinans]
CASSHQKCKSVFTFESPTRLLDLGSDEPQAIDTIRLINSKTLQSDAQYTILSYCWGTSVSHGLLRTTLSTLDVHSGGIKVDALPKTFQDAIRLTRAISTRYIWIDSLCIIQDDPTDWEKEAEKMAAYFQNSLLTIAATSAADSTTGPKLADRFNVMRSPLNKRGWVLQEIVLSTRVLHCAQDQWYWQCREHINSEDGVVAEPDVDFVADDWHDWRKYPLHRQIIGQWNHLAVAYSKRTLTYEKDKLAAFAGITNYFQQRSNDEPILGAWKTTLAYDLHWTTVYDERDQAPPPKEDAIWLRLPSWSWMSTPSKIR